MAGSTRAPRTAEIVLGTVFALAGLVLLYVAVFEAGRWPCWVVGFLLLVFSGFAMIPEWRDPFGSGLSRIKVVLSWLSVDIGRDRVPAAPQAQAEKAPDAVHPVQPELRAVIQEDFGTRVLAALKHTDDPLAYWSVAVDLTLRQDYGSAATVIDSALERYPEHPKLLISAGYMWARQKELSRAIEAAKRAVAGARDRAEFREQFFLANANLCYYLAERADSRDRASALEAGKLASDHADEFSNRASFRINYGFALIRFASSRDDLVAGVAYLLDLHRRDLKDEERAEVNQYLQLGMGTLLALDTPSQGKDTA